MRNYLRKLMMVLLMVLIIFLGIFGLFNLLYNQTYLPPELVSTAEYILKSSINPPDWMRIKPPPNEILHKDEPIEISLYMCPEMLGSQDCKSPLRVKDGSYQLMGLYRQWSNFYVNGQKSNFLLFSGGGNISGGTLSINLHPLLLPGRHLFKIEPAASIGEQENPDPKLSYEWAYRVE
jgi:hypothetical protein